jgi:MFS family permease
MIITGNIQPWHVYLTSLGLATVQSFQHPSRASMVSDTVPRECLTNAFGLNAVVFNMARSAGPALAGLLITAFGTGGSYSAHAVFYLLATIWTIMLRPERRSSAARDGGAHRGESFGQNIIEVGNSAGAATKSASAFGGIDRHAVADPVHHALPVFARDIFKSAPRGRGLLTSMGIGALFSSVLVASSGTGCRAESS